MIPNTSFLSDRGYSKKTVVASFENIIFFRIEVIPRKLAAILTIASSSFFNLLQPPSTFHILEAADWRSSRVTRLAPHDAPEINASLFRVQSTHRSQNLPTPTGGDGQLILASIEVLKVCLEAFRLHFPISLSFGLLWDKYNSLLFHSRDIWRMQSHLFDIVTFTCDW